MASFFKIVLTYVGVVPGKGVCPGPRNSRRVTFMVGFWEKIQSKERGVDCPGPGQPYPGRHSSIIGQCILRSNYTWPTEMVLLADFSIDGCSSVSSCVEWINPIPLLNVWESVVHDEEGVAKVLLPETPHAAHYNACFQGF